jgi:hypothetical protein
LAEQSKEGNQTNLSKETGYHQGKKMRDMHSKHWHLSACPEHLEAM